ncbi:MAG: minor capsid protein [Bifidobacteriaceae bacterium]|jgi:hypothetical protein|nr:minor capsid protein [Bifidobacteriaceae bacterium]
MASPTSDVLEELAKLLSAAGVGIWKDSTSYDANDTAIFMKTMPESPDRCIVLNLTPVTDNATLPTGTMLLQVACRGSQSKPLDPDDLCDQCFDVLHGLTDHMCGDCTIVQANRISSASMGDDDTKRWVRADQYELDVDYPPTNLRPIRGAW